MGFNLLPLSIIPNFRITNKDLVDVNTMKIVSLFEQCFSKIFNCIKTLYLYGVS